MAIDLISKFAPKILIEQLTANHIIYGGLLGLVTILVSHYGFHNTGMVPYLHGLAVATVVSFGKKIFDYYNEHETLKMCLEKAFATIIIPFGLAIIKHLAI